MFHLTTNTIPHYLILRMFLFGGVGRVILLHTGQESSNAGLFSITIPCGVPGFRVKGGETACA